MRRALRQARGMDVGVGVGALTACCGEESGGEVADG